MSWTDSAGLANTACLAAFGEPVYFITPGFPPISVNVIWFSQVPEGMATFFIAQAWVIVSTLPASPSRGDLISRGEIQYVVKDLTKADAYGGVCLQLIQHS